MTQVLNWRGAHRRTASRLHLRPRPTCAVARRAAAARTRAPPPRPRPPPATRKARTFVRPPRAVRAR
eukprot:scaffold5188_cov101-Isochrysis_galbana.AAC.1